MAYNTSNYPISMKNLNTDIRHKAIDILNSLVEDKHMEPGIAIPTAISRAKDWAANRNKPVSPSHTDDKKHGEDVYVVPHSKGWAIKKEKNERVSYVFKKKMEAVSRARNIAIKNKGSLVIQRKDGTIKSKISYTK